MRGGTVTVPEGKTYKAYKVFDIEKSTSTNGFIYTISVADGSDGLKWANKLWSNPKSNPTNVSGNKWFDAKVSLTQDTLEVMWTGSPEPNTVTEDVKRAALDFLAKNIPTGLQTNPTELTSTNCTLTDGYWLIVEEGDGVPAGVAVTSASEKIDITTKVSTIPTIDKNIVAVKGQNNFAKSKEAKVIVGDDVTFEITVHIPKNSAADKVVKVTDILDQGLDMNLSKDVTAIWIADKGNTDSTNVSLPKNFTGENGEYTYEIPATAKGGTVTLKYVTTLTGTQANAYKNTAYLTFNGADSVQVVNTVNTNNVKPNPDSGDNDEGNQVAGPFTITKYDGKDGKYLAGAKFQIYRPDGTVIKFKADGATYTASNDTAAVDVIDMTTNTTVKIAGLAGKVKIKEIQAPKGYNKCNDIEFDVDAKMDKGRIHTHVETPGTWIKDTSAGLGIENNSGKLLPSTGGIGTTIFYVAGAILLLVAVVVLIVRRRMNEDN